MIVLCCQLANAQYHYSPGQLLQQAPVPPTPTNPFSQQRSQVRATNQAQIDALNGSSSDRKRQADEALREIKADQNRQAQQAKQAFIVANQRFYEDTYAKLEEMLAGRRYYDLKLAVFLTENAFMNGELDYGNFSTEVYALAQLCKSLTPDSARPDPSARFLALHRVMTDTLSMPAADKRPYVHFPPTYDFTDFWGTEDYTKQFVSKLLVSNSGQCHSLPLLYKLVADELGVKAYLSMAPNHCYIQVKDNRGTLYSYETTRGFFVSDAYYMSSGFIKAGALKQRAYLDTLTRTEALACRLFDLAQGYAWRYGHDAFTTKCAALGLKYYPHSVQGRMLAHDAAYVDFVAAWRVNGKPTQEQARQNPRLHPLLEEVERLTRAVDELGHEEMPADQYARWLQQIEQEQARTANQQATNQFQQTTRNKP